MALKSTKYNRLNLKESYSWHFFQLTLYKEANLYQNPSALYLLQKVKNLTFSQIVLWANK